MWETGAVPGGWLGRAGSASLTAQGRIQLNSTLATGNAFRKHLHVVVRGTLQHQDLGVLAQSFCGLCRENETLVHSHARHASDALQHLLANGDALVELISSIKPPCVCNSFCESHGGQITHARRGLSCMKRQEHGPLALLALDTAILHCCCTQIKTQLIFTFCCVSVRLAVL